MNNEPNCWTCAYRDLPETAEPCASCDMYFSHFESSEPTESTDTAASEDARRCSLCKFRDTLLVQSPCQKCALTPGLPCYTVDTNKLVEMEKLKREEAKQKEAEMAGPTCLTCKHKGVSILEEPCISCNGYQNYTPDESAPCAEGTDENDDVIEPCNTCTHRDNLRCNPPCSHCRQERGIEYPEYEEAEEDEEDVPSPCATCKYGDLPGTVGPCASCFDEGLDHPLNYEEATDSGDEAPWVLGTEESCQSILLICLPKEWGKRCDGILKPTMLVHVLAPTAEKSRRSWGKPSIPERNIAMSSATGPSFFLIAFPFMASLAKKR